MNPNRVISIVVLLLGLSVAGRADASLMGQTITCSDTSTNYNCSSNTAMVGAGSEFSLDRVDNTNFGFSVDFDNTSVEVFYTGFPSIGLGGPEVFTFGDLFWSNDLTATITGIANFATFGGTSTFGIGDITTAANAITINFGNNSWIVDSPVIGFSFDLVTTHDTVVPLPAAAWLFGSALLGLGIVKRRKA